MKEEPEKTRWRRWIGAVRSFLWRASVRLFAWEHLRQLYLGVLAREPDSPGAAGYLERVKSTGAASEALSLLLSSEEFYHKSGSLLAPHLVQALFRGVLGREADPVGREEYTLKLKGGEKLETVLAGMLESEEFRKMGIARLSPDLVNAAYRAILERDPDPKGFEENDAWLRENHNLAALLTTLIKSTEFQQLSILRIIGRRPAVEDIQAIKTIFLHIPKTGGTTFREALSSCFAPSQICPERFDRLHRYSAGRLASYRFFSGHFSFHSCEMIPGPKRIFTVLRHPVGRLVSQYNFHRAHDDEVIQRDGLWLAALARGHSMHEYFSLEEVRRHPWVNNAMVRRLASPFSTERWESAADIGENTDAFSLLPLAKERLRSLMAFGILERYQDSIELISNALGLPPPHPLTPQMVLSDVMGDPGFRNIEPQACDHYTMEVMSPLVDAGLALYDYAVSLFRERLSVRRSQSLHAI